jgi:hypothetical protein
MESQQLPCFVGLERSKTEKRKCEITKRTQEISPRLFFYNNLARHELGFAPKRTQDLGFSWVEKAGANPGTNPTKLP